ncbi:Multidrug resistance protein MdtG [Escherichia coli]|nr:Multidrug resistance protein MdtG [Escherichia coli]CTX44373.1 Multidrug resistance protein MdtG [Escherichia coli]CTX71638.1 Multidrug resistance protein MdtG [Escherichia coli]CTY20124.1 Multidrug resistance protein MdtG [Escherichia coli]CTZ53524.1 Multidrug resistance protein MdtG [Escherichia coli]
MSPCENDTPINWKRNLIVAWLGCFLTGAAFSLVMPFLPLYVEQLGVTGHSALNMWSGIVFSITFLFSAIASPFWGGLADRKGRKLMLLRSALGMGIVMVLMGLAQNIWQFLILRALLGLLGGFVPNANALIATQVPRNKSGWALGTLSTGALVVRCSAQWLAACSPIATAYVRYSLLPPVCSYSAFSSPCFASEKNSSRSAKKRCCTCGKW